MKHYDLLVIGFGKGGKTLAAKLSTQGKKVALVEENSTMYGGTCINIGCIPTKTLLHAAEIGLSFDEAMQDKEDVVEKLNKKNFTMIDSLADVYTAKASFISNKVVELKAGNEIEHLSADIIVINTGAISNQLPIEGLSTTKYVYDSTGIQKLKQQPKHLGIIGGGNIGLEFATLYAKLGSKVTIFESNDTILKRYEPFVSELATKYLEEQGVKFELNAKVLNVKNQDEAVIVETTKSTYTFDALLYATGRKPNIEGLGLENTDIEITDRGAIKVDEFCQTSVENVFAVGDVNGGLQFTYVSLDDFRIVFNYLNGNKEYSLNHRKNVPNTVFINPPLSQVGLTEEQVKQQGVPYATKELPVATMPRGHVNQDLRGMFKAIINTETKQILGATLFGAQSHEIINLITIAMDNHIPYTYFMKQLFTHPTMAENLNDLFAI